MTYTRLFVQHEDSERLSHLTFGTRMRDGKASDVVSRVLEELGKLVFNFVSNLGVLSSA